MGAQSFLWGVSMYFSCLGGFSVGFPPTDQSKTLLTGHSRYKCVNVAFALQWPEKLNEQ